MTLDNLVGVSHGEAGIDLGHRFFKMGIVCHGFGVLDKAVPIEHSHGLTADGKTVAPHFEHGGSPGVSKRLHEGSRQTVLHNLNFFFSRLAGEAG